MSDLIKTLRALIRSELKRLHLSELGTVTQVFARESDSGDENHQVNIKLLSSGVELQRVPVVTGRLGLSALPNLDDLMLVSFIGGDLNAPVAVGCLYDDQSHPPVAKAHEVVYQPPDDESADTRRFQLELPNGGAITVQDEVVTVVMGASSVTINTDGDVEIVAEGNLALQAKGDLTIESNGKIDLTAQGDLTLTGMSAALKAQTSATVKGAQVVLAGMTEFKPS